MAQICHNKDFIFSEIVPISVDMDFHQNSGNF